MYIWRNTQSQISVTHFLRIAIETLSSLPSIVVGLFDIWSSLCSRMRNGTFLRSTCRFHSEPAAYIHYDRRRSALYPKAIKRGVSVWEPHLGRLSLRFSCHAAPRIITGVILAAGRGFGEAARAFLYTAGMSTDINCTVWNIASPTCALNPFRPGETLSLPSGAQWTEALSKRILQKFTNLSSAVLMIMVLDIFSILAHTLEGHQEKNGDKMKHADNTVQKVG